MPFPFPVIMIPGDYLAGLLSNGHYLCVPLALARSLGVIARSARYLWWVPPDETAVVCDHPGAEIARLDRSGLLRHPDVLIEGGAYAVMSPDAPRRMPIRAADPARQALLIGCAFVVGCGPGESPGRATHPTPPAIEGFITTGDSVRIWHRSVGAGAETVVAPALLYLGRDLDGLVRPGRRLVLYDPRGRGRSDSVPPSKTGLERDLSDLDAVRGAVGADSVALIGWSGTAMEMAVYAFRHPSRVTRLVLLAPVGPRWDPWWEAMRARGRARTDSGALARLEARVAAGDFAGDPAGWCRELAAVTNPSGFADTGMARAAPDVCDSPNEWPERYGRYVGSLLQSFGRFDLRPELARSTIPLLVIHGEHDNIPLEASREWVARRPNGRLLVVPGAAHWPQRERPAVTVGAIREFLDGRWPAGVESVPE